MRRLFYLLFAGLLVACSSIDCPVNNIVAMQYNICNADGSEWKLTDSLTVTTQRSDGSDTILLNRGIDISAFSLPVSYSHPEDVLCFSLSNFGVKAVDTVWIQKEDIPHFESVDCNVSFFHEIKDLRYTNNGIDSIVINNPSVTYDAETVNFRIYFKTFD